MNEITEIYVYGNEYHDIHYGKQVAATIMQKMDKQIGNGNGKRAKYKNRKKKMQR